MDWGAVLKVVDRAALVGLVVSVMLASLLWGLDPASGGGSPGGRVSLVLVGLCLSWVLGRRVLGLRRIGLDGLAWVGIACWVVVAAACMICTDVTGMPSGGREIALVTLWITLPLAFLASDAGWFFALRPSGMIARSLRVIAFGTACLSVLLWWLGPWVWPSALMRGGGPGGLLLMLGWFAFTAISHALVPAVMRRDQRVRVEQEHRRGDRALMTLQCPRCLLWVQMHSGVILCPGCSLRLRLEFEEPRCGCGYPLHRLSGPHCPECGFEVPPAQRWGAARGPSVPPSAESPTPPGA